jgi:hypothetical protein
LQLPIFPDGLTPITNDIAFQRQDGKVVCFHGCLPVFQHEEKDLKSLRMFTSQLVVRRRWLLPATAAAGAGCSHSRGAGTGATVAGWGQERAGSGGRVGALDALAEYGIEEIPAVQKTLH